MLFVGTREKYFIRLYQKQGVATWDELEGTAKNLTMAMDEGEPGPLAVVSAGPPQAGTRVPRRWSVLARCRLVPGSLGGGRCWPAAGWYPGPLAVVSAASPPQAGTWGHGTATPNPVGQTVS